MKRKIVSVIITCKNSESTIKALLDSLKKQSYKKIEIVIVDNASSDDTKKISAMFTKRIFDKGPERSAQRNWGAKQAVGEYLLFLDSDMELSKRVIEECVLLFETEDGKDLGGVIIPEKSFGEGIWAQAKILEREINRGEEYFEAARFFPTTKFWELKGYDESLTGPEDWDFPQRIAKKYDIKSIKSFIYHNEGKLSLTNLVKKKYYYGLSVHKYLQKQNLPSIGPKTIYFLRKGFYTKWRMLFDAPLVTLAMIFMLSVELCAGGAGYLRGRFKR